MQTLLQCSEGATPVRIELALKLTFIFYLVATFCMQLCSIGTRRRQFNDDPEEQPEAIGGDGASSRSCAPPVKKVMKSHLKIGAVC